MATPSISMTESLQETVLQMSPSVLCEDLLLFFGGFFSDPVQSVTLAVSNLAQSIGRRMQL